MGYKDENLKHRLGLEAGPRYTCSKCQAGLNIPKIVSIVVCTKCKSVLSKEEIQDNK